MNTDEAVRRPTEVVRRKHLELATGRNYGAWLRRYCDFLKALPLHLPSEHKWERFLTVLAQKDVTASTLRQARSAIIFSVWGETKFRRPGVPGGLLCLSSIENTTVILSKSTKIAQKSPPN